MSLNVVQEISKEFIKPSVPTPDHLKTFHLSLLDQISPPLYTPTILFYGPPATSDHEQHLNISDRLKRSLSETLTRFYPVAGRIKGNNNMILECNDEGIEYIEARVDGSISNFMKRDALQHLLPANVDLHARGIMDNDPQSIIKVTFFGCGGMAVCICLSHKIADASTLTTFITSWGSIARGGDTDANYPTFEASIIYPHREEIPAFASTHDESSMTTTDHDENSVPKISSKRLVLDAPKIAALRAKYADPSVGNYPTRVEAVSTLVWKTAMAASSSTRPCVAMHAVNMRKRMDPPLPPQAFGNIVILATTTPIMKESTGDIELVRVMNKSMSKIDADYVKAMQGDEGVLRLQETINMMMQAQGSMETYTFSSWCRFPLYETNFGWGIPTWVTKCAFKPFKNMFSLMDSNSVGDGIEVFVGMEEEELAIFELDQELLEFVSIID